MAVASSNNDLFPSGVLGPPDVLVGSATVTGDATMGTATISFTLPAGFLWMPNYMSFQHNIAGVLNARFSALGTDDGLGATFSTYSEVIQKTAITTAPANSATVRYPKMLIKTVTGPAELRCEALNVDTVVFRAYCRVLRWDKAADPQAWLAFMVAPP